MRDSKGEVDRVTMLPESLVEPLRQHLQRGRMIHLRDLDSGYGAVYLPYALETTMIYTHVLNRGPMAVRSPMD